MGFFSVAVTKYFEVLNTNCLFYSVFAYCIVLSQCFKSLFYLSVCLTECWEQLTGIEHDL